jgi:hypothetical protein
MTETATISTETGETTEDGTSGTPEPDSGSETPKGNREARYRVERNEARTALAEAQGRIADLQTRELHRLAGEHLAQAEDITLSGKSLADFLTPEGWVDHEAVAEAAADVIESRPGLAKYPKDRAVDPTQGMGNDRPGKGSLTWGDLFR